MQHGPINAPESHSAIANPSKHPIAVSLAMRSLAQQPSTFLETMFATGCVRNQPVRAWVQACMWSTQWASHLHDELLIKACDGCQRFILGEELHKCAAWTSKPRPARATSCAHRDSTRCMIEPRCGGFGGSRDRRKQRTLRLVRVAAHDVHILHPPELLEERGDLLRRGRFGEAAHKQLVLRCACDGTAEMRWSPVEFRAVFYRQRLQHARCF